MAIFTKNKNPKALIGNQKLFKICCGDTVIDPCCYDSDNNPPVICSCEFERSMNINGDLVPYTNFITLSQASDLPASIQLHFKNISNCSIFFTEVSVTSTSQYVTALLPVDPYELTSGTNTDVFGFTMSALAGFGSYTVDIQYKLCDFSYIDTIELLITT
jgi:hypothetical protein